MKANCTIEIEGIENIDDFITELQIMLDDYWDVNEEHKEIKISNVVNTEE